MRVLGQLAGLVGAVTLPLLVVAILLWNLVLPGVAEFICGAVDQVAFNIALVVVMLVGTWFAGLVSGSVVYKQMDAANDSY